MQKLKNDIKNKTFSPCYLLYGEEDYLKKNYKKRLKEAIVGDDTMNYSYYEGKGILLTEVIHIADTLPFFADSRLIIIENSGLFKSGGEALTEYLGEMPESTHIVFIEMDVDKRSRLFKKVKEKGDLVEMARQPDSQLASWAAGLLGKENLKITGKTMELFLNKVGNDMNTIATELEKLIAYTMGQEIVTDEDIKAVCTEQITNKIFDMIGFLAVKNRKSALMLYQDLLMLKEPPMRILFLIARQFNQLLMAKDIVMRGGNRDTASSKMKVAPFIAAKLMKQASSFTEEQLLGYVIACVEAEEAVKTGKMDDQLAVELLITR